MRVVIDNTKCVGSLWRSATRPCLGSGRQAAILRTFHYRKQKSCRSQRESNIMRKPSASSHRRESFAFAGSRADDPPENWSYSQECVQGVPPTPPPSLDDKNRGAPTSVTAAAVVLGLGLACTLAWQKLSNKLAGKRQDQGQTRSSERQRQSRMPEAFQTMTPQQAQEPEYSDSHPGSRASPVIANSSSLLAQTQAVQGRLTEERNAPGGPADSAQDPTPTPSEDPSAIDPSLPATEADTVHQVDVQQQKPFAASGSEMPPDTNIDLSLSDDSASDDAEEEAGAAEQAASNLSTSAFSASELPATATISKSYQDTQSASVAPQDAVGHSKPDSAKRPGKAQPELLDESASTTEATTMQHRQAVATAPLEDAAAPSGDTGLVISSATPAAAALGPSSASASAPVQLEDGRTVGTSSLDDAAAPEQASEVGQPDGAHTLREEQEEELQAAPRPKSWEEPAQAAAGQDPLREEEEEEEAAEIRRIRETEKPPALAALDSSVLDEPDLSIRRSPKLFERPPQDVKAPAAQDGGSLPRPTASTSSSVAQQPEAGLNEDEESKQALSAIASKPSSASVSDDMLSSGTPREAEASPDRTSAEAAPSSAQDEGSDSDAAQSEAAELRRQMAQLRQAMEDTAAAMEAAQSQALSTDQSSAPSEHPEAQPSSPRQQQAEEDLPSPSQSQPRSQQQSQTQARSESNQELPSESLSSASEATAPGSASVSASTAEEEQPPPTATRRQPAPTADAQQPPPTADAQQPPPREPLRVLPRPQPTSESATIFIEPSPAAEEIRSHPVAPDEGQGAEDGEAVDLVAVAAGAMLPHPDKAETGGEDAFFVTSFGRGAFGVADGVGGWNVEGVDPSRYSRLLMEYAEQAIQQGQGEYEGGARDVVGLAHAGITRQGEQEGEVILGSTTVCLAVLKPGGLLEVANVGDSGFRIIRGNEAVYASEAQQHEFNMPFQLACPGPDQYSDTCEDACLYELELEPGDVIVLATDGVLDNLWDDQMAQLVFHCLRSGPRTDSMAQECARLIVETAQQNSFNPKFRSPWIVEAARAGALPFWQRFKPEGGKVDDCTAVVVCLEPAATQSRRTSDRARSKAAV